jgi:hypothetical protein
MGKYDSGYKPVPRDLYPTRERWIVEALADHFILAGKRVWEPACGRGDMVRSLRALGCRVYASDIVDYGRGQDEVLDFLSGRSPKFDWQIGITNPPFGNRHSHLAIAFIRTGLNHFEQGRGEMFALLMPNEFDAREARIPFFRDCPYFRAKIILTRRPIWFKRTDGKREEPKNTVSAWYVWQREPLRRPRLLLYAPQDAAP